MKLVPIPRMRSARAKKSSTAAGRVRAAVPSDSGWSSGNALLPLSVVATGVFVSSASCRSSEHAFAYSTPWPATITGAEAASSIRAVSSTSPPAACVSRGGDEAMLQSAVPASPLRTSFATATSTGPLRTPRSAFNAWRNTAGPCAGWFSVAAQRVIGR